eukprot:Awhi_evm1s10223
MSDSRRLAFDYQDATLYPFKVFTPIRVMVGVGIILGASLPRYISIPLGGLMIAGSLGKAVLARLGLYTDPLTKLVIPGRQTVVRKDSFVIFHLGSRPNNQLDSFYLWMGSAFDEIKQELDDHPELGCFGSEVFYGVT